MAQKKIIASAVAENSGGIYKTELTISQHLLIADELNEVGGKDEGPAPGDYMCMALGSCKAITLRMYAERKKWKLNNIKIKTSLVKGSEMESGTNTFYCEIEVTGELSDEQRQRLLEIAKACPIDRLLRKPSEIVSLLI